ncbi:MAG: hypothetical protein EOP33_08105 [Rickettsiaceae bacterium]|nr:MAG: hypothetical protein EOP33_08105 [Rickettsiaceae bacterium]
MEPTNLCYLTKNNVKKILPNIDYNNFFSSEQVYKTPIFFFSKKEEKTLLGFKEFLINPQSFISRFYKPVDFTDHYQYLYEGNKPAYHASSDCIRLASDFTNIVIPKTIRDKGTDEVVRFRKWYTNYLNEADKEKRRRIADDAVFRQKLLMEFGINYTDLNDIQYDNSGVENFTNISLPDLEKRIDTIIRESKFYFINSTPEEKEIIKKYQKATSLGYLSIEIQNNDTGMTDDSLKSFLRTYDTKFKKPIKNLLLEYYRVQHNPSLKFEGSLLEQLNFKPCSSCYGKYISIDEL